MVTVSNAIQMSEASLNVTSFVVSITICITMKEKKENIATNEG